MGARATTLFLKGLSASVAAITGDPSAKVPPGHSKEIRIYTWRSWFPTNVARSRYSSSLERQLVCCSTKDLFLKVSEENLRLERGKLDANDFDLAAELTISHRKRGQVVIFFYRRCRIVVQNLQFYVLLSQKSIIIFPSKRNTRAIVFCQRIATKGGQVLGFPIEHAESLQIDKRWSYVLEEIWKAYRNDMKRQSIFVVRQLYSE